MTSVVVVGSPDQKNKSRAGRRYSADNYYYDREGFVTRARLKHPIVDILTSDEIERERSLTESNFSVNDKDTIYRDDAIKPLEVGTVVHGSESNVKQSTYENIARQKSWTYYDRPTSLILRASKRKTKGKPSVANSYSSKDIVITNTRTKVEENSSKQSRTSLKNVTDIVEDEPAIILLSLDKKRSTDNDIKHRVHESIAHKNKEITYSVREQSLPVEFVDFEQNFNQIEDKPRILYPSKFDYEELLSSAISDNSSSTVEIRRTASESDTALSSGNEHSVRSSDIAAHWKSRKTNKRYSGSLGSFIYDDHLGRQRNRQKRILVYQKAPIYYEQDEEQEPELEELFIFEGDEPYRSLIRYHSRQAQPANHSKPVPIDLYSNLSLSDTFSSTASVKDMAATITVNPPKFSPSLYGPYYKDRAPTSVSVNNEYNAVTSSQPIDEDNYAQTTYNVSGRQSRRGGTTTVVETVNGATQRQPMTETITTETSRSREGLSRMSEEVNPSLYGPYYVQSSNRAVDRYNLSPRPTPRDSTRSSYTTTDNQTLTTRRSGSRTVGEPVYNDTAGYNNVQYLQDYDLRPPVYTTRRPRRTTINGPLSSQEAYGEVLTEEDGRSISLDQSGGTILTARSRIPSPMRIADLSGGEVVSTTVHTEPDGTKVETQTIRQTTKRRSPSPRVAYADPIASEFDPRGEVVSSTIHVEPDGTRVETQTIKQTTKRRSPSPSKVVYLGGRQSRNLVKEPMIIDGGEIVDSRIHTERDRTRVETQTVRQTSRRSSRSPDSMSKIRGYSPPVGEIVDSKIHIEPDGTRVETQTIKHTAKRILKGADYMNGRQSIVSGPMFNFGGGEIVDTTITTEPDGTRIETQTIKHTEKRRPVTEVGYVKSRRSRSRPPFDYTPADDEIFTQRRSRENSPPGEIVNTTVHTEPDGTRIETQTIKHTTINKKKRPQVEIKYIDPPPPPSPRPSPPRSRVVYNPPPQIVETRVRELPTPQPVETHLIKVPPAKVNYVKTRLTGTRMNIQKLPAGDVVDTTVRQESDGSKLEIKTIRHTGKRLPNETWTEASTVTNTNLGRRKTINYNSRPINTYKRLPPINSTEYIVENGGGGGVSTTSTTRIRGTRSLNDSRTERTRIDGYESDYYHETRDYDLNEEELSMMRHRLRRRTTVPAAHDTWPMYKYVRSDGIAVMVRTTPGKIDSVRDYLRLVDGVGSAEQAKMPDLPATEFDADEQVVLSPMQLVWATNPPPNVAPIYIIMPVNSMLYNESLQQLMFMYTVNYKAWQFAEGRIIQIPVNGVIHDFYEVQIPQPFQNVIFDIKMRYFENTREIGPEESGEVNSSMENGVRVISQKRTFDDVARLKIRVEPLDMNETDLSQLIPGADTVNAIAVSPIVKVTSSQQTKRPIVISIPKPGQSIFGSTKLGLKTKPSECRAQRVVLYTKDRQVAKYQQDNTLRQGSGNNYEFDARIWKAGGSVYAFLALNGEEPPGNANGDMDRGDSDFLSTVLFERIAASDAGREELKVGGIGRQLLDYNTTSDIMRNNEDNPEAALVQILRRWKRSNKRLDESGMVRQLVLALRENGNPAESSSLQARFRRYLMEQEGSNVLIIFDELSRSPAVMVNWHVLGRVLGLSDSHLKRIQEGTHDLRKRCYTALRVAFERLKNEEEFYREIVLRYIAALRKIGCPNIADSIERRHLSKFYRSAVDT